MGFTSRGTVLSSRGTVLSSRGIVLSSRGTVLSSRGIVLSSRGIVLSNENRHGILIFHLFIIFFDSIFITRFFFIIYR